MNWMLWVLLTGGLWRVTLHDGSITQGELRSWNGSAAVLATDQGEKSIELAQIQTVESMDDRPAPDMSASQMVVLKDGSSVLVDQLTLDQGQLTLQASGNVSWNLKADQLQSVRFGPRKEAQDDQWNELAQQARDSDSVVVIRPTGALDHAVGIVESISANDVRFEFGGKPVNLPRQRLAGVLLSRPAGTAAVRAPLVVETTRGDRWQIESLTLVDDGWQGRSLAGVDIRWKADELRRIVPQVAAFEYLSRLDPLEQSWQPFLAANPAETADLSLLFQPQRDRSFLSPTLAVRTAAGSAQWQEYDRGLAIHSRSELVYRLGRKYRRLTATVGIDPRLARPGHVVLSIYADDRSVFEGAIDGQQPGRMLDLDLNGASRLKIVVDYGDRYDTGDHLNLCDAKLWE